MKKKDGIIMRTIGDASVLVPTGRRVVDLNCLVVLNETGRCLWELLDGNHSIDDLASALANRFEVDLDRARIDTAAFISELLKMEILDGAESAR